MKECKQYGCDCIIEAVDDELLEVLFPNSTNAPLTAALVALYEELMRDGAVLHLRHGIAAANPILAARDAVTALLTERGLT